MKKILYIPLFIFYISCSSESAKKSNSSNSVTSSKEAIVYQPGAYNLLADSSKVAWLGTELTTKTHFGSLRAHSGNLKIDKGGEVAGNITIDMQSIIVEDLKGRSKEVLENHLKSDDFFGSDNFPTATLEFRSLNRYDNDGGQIFNGNLTIKGITNEVEFSAKLIKQTPLLHAVGKLVFDRSKYNVRFRSGSFFDDLGDKLILDNIEVDINLIAEPA
ncbi:YceI family protein [bacterium]|nr:YceI family protein [bacterium]|tara:strand:- start:1404 stop:2054 length:651 start_codon:yes stop_codon:yes gene_type:complete